MIREGLTDAALDADARALVVGAESIRESDACVETVLLMAAQTELGELQAAAAETAKQVGWWGLGAV